MKRDRDLEMFDVAEPAGGFLHSLDRHIYRLEGIWRFNDKIATNRLILVLAARNCCNSRFSLNPYPARLPLGSDPIF